jgi:hypothetical protein
MKQYPAPWSRSLIVISTMATLICVAVAITLFWSGRIWPGLLPIAIVVVALLFTIRGYTVTPDAILVHRLLWTTRLRLAGLDSAVSKPDAMRRSIRAFGNGGLFSFSGSFRNTAFGAYRAFVTDPHRTVVLHFPTRTIIVSPSAPEDFVHDVELASHAV